MDSFLWWSGVITWAVAGFVGFFELLDWIIDRTVRGLWTKREFLMFVADRLQSKAARTTQNNAEIGGGK